MTTDKELFYYSNSSTMWAHRARRLWPPIGPDGQRLTPEELEELEDEEAAHGDYLHDRDKNWDATDEIERDSDAR